jgi:hypothetical protein
MADFKRWLAEKYPRGRPESETTVIISSYETYCTRGLEVKLFTTRQSTYADFSL